MNGIIDGHGEWTDRLSEYMDGGLAPDDHAEVEAHLAECGECRRVLEDLRAVAAQARELGPREPTRDLWAGIAATIEAPTPESAPEGARVIQLPTGAGDPTGGQRSPRRTFALTSPQLAAASVALIALSSWATWSLRPTPQAAATDAAVVEGVIQPAASEAAPPPELARELAGLEAAVSEVRDVLDPNTVRILQRNLGIIEQAIADSQRALAQDPENEFLREHLQRVYQRKAEYLRDAARVAERTG